MFAQRFLVLFTLALTTAACAQPKRQILPAPCPAPQTDPRVLDGLARIEGAVRASSPGPSSGVSETLADLAAQRLALAAKYKETKKTIDALVVRIQTARKAARALAESDTDRAIIAETMLDLDEGKPMPKLAKRLMDREPIKDAAEASALLTKAREQAKRLEAQLDALDATLASAGPANVVAP